MSDTPSIAARVIVAIPLLAVVVLVLRGAVADLDMVVVLRAVADVDAGVWVLTLDMVVVLLLRAVAES